MGHLAGTTRARGGRQASATAELFDSIQRPQSNGDDGDTNMGVAKVGEDARRAVRSDIRIAS